MGNDPHGLRGDGSARALRPERWQASSGSAVRQCSRESRHDGGSGPLWKWWRLQTSGPCSRIKTDMAAASEAVEEGGRRKVAGRGDRVVGIGSAAWDIVVRRVGVGVGGWGFEEGGGTTEESAGFRNEGSIENVWKVGFAFVHI